MDRHDSLDKKGISAISQTLQLAIAYEFTQVKFLEQAMTHSSAVNEQLQNVEHNERLEFLGDAVLELCISHALYTLFPHAREGQLTAMRSQLVNQDTLLDWLASCDWMNALFLEKEKNVKGKDAGCVACRCF